MSLSTIELSFECTRLIMDRVNFTSITCARCQSLMQKEQFEGTWDMKFINKPKD
jgi:hypothetical protein